jgi:BirA family biotin operon repressor/biotin-[acetyl-CoA-carboxylase] ligase
MPAAPAPESERTTSVSTFATHSAPLNISLLERLRAAGGDFVPLDGLGPDLERVRSDLDALGSFGFGIEQHPYRGAAYSGPAERLCPDQIEHRLATRRIGRRIAVWNRVPSTNDLAARAGTSASNDGLVVLAEEQTAGRGRRGRSWTAPPRSSILMSALIFPPQQLARELPEPTCRFACLTVLAAIATAEVVGAWTGRNATIKWPNDVRVAGRKIAGILVERAPAPGRRLPPSPGALQAQPCAGVVVGIGLNANMTPASFPPGLAAGATSLQIERDGAAIDRSELARDLIGRLDHWYELIRSHGAHALDASWCARSEHSGCIVRVVTPSATLTGRLIALDVEFGLTLLLESAPRQPSTRGAAPPVARLPISDVLTLEPADDDRTDHTSPGAD